MCFRLQLAALRRLALMGALGVALAGGAAFGQTLRELERAELGYLNADVRAEVERRATGSNTARGVVYTMLLNNLQLRYPAQEVLAVDFPQSTVAYRATDGATRTVRFNTGTLALAD